MQVCFPAGDAEVVAVDAEVVAGETAAVAGVVAGVTACDSSNLLEIDCWISGKFLDSLVTKLMVLLTLKLSLFSLSEFELFTLISVVSWL